MNRTSTAKDMRNAGCFTSSKIALPGFCNKSHLSEYSYIVK